MGPPWKACFLQAVARTPAIVPFVKEYRRSQTTAYTSEGFFGRFYQGCAGTFRNTGFVPIAAKVRVGSVYSLSKLYRSPRRLQSISRHSRPGTGEVSMRGPFSLSAFFLTINDSSRCLSGQSGTGTATTTVTATAFLHHCWWNCRA